MTKSKKQLTKQQQKLQANLGIELLCGAKTQLIGVTKMKNLSQKGQAQKTKMVI